MTVDTGGQVYLLAAGTVCAVLGVVTARIARDIWRNSSPNALKAYQNGNLLLSACLQAVIPVAGAMVAGAVMMYAVALVPGLLVISAVGVIGFLVFGMLAFTVGFARWPGILVPPPFRQQE